MIQIPFDIPQKYLLVCSAVSRCLSLLSDFNWVLSIFLSVRLINDWNLSRIRPIGAGVGLRLPQIAPKSIYRMGAAQPVSGLPGRAQTK
jgi:hypothetical protein